MKAEFLTNLEIWIGCHIRLYCLSPPLDVTLCQDLDSAYIFLVTFGYKHGKVDNS